ncbi:related to gtp-binding protein engb [Fusarium torulosum]|uniref:Related to gtp-binding protein engb n=1 Tax=Fusarium torulosum TaxID=33205 RepID=A0AAE8M6X3_9HYPO|nr:related to gtp-binding protein engb [Fusarium torulosum]
MSQPRLWRASRLPSFLSSTNTFGHRALFSTSFSLSLRRRPIRRTTIGASRQAQQASDPVSAPSAGNLPTSSKPEPQDAGSHDTTKDNITTSVLPNSNASDARKAKAPKSRGPLPKGIKPYQQVLFQSESLRFKEGSSVPVGASKEDQSPLAAAEKFFGEDCRILYSAESFYHHPHNDHIPEIVVLGASNAGKSSFLNALVGGMEVAKVSHKPGKTTTMNAYGVGPRPKIAKELVRKGDAPPKHSLVLMDTPGYGFKSQVDWGKTILKYLNARKMLRGAIILIPADKKLQETDRWMLRTLARSNTRTLVVITKADKPGNGWQDACHNLQTQIQGIVSGLEAHSAASWREGSDRMLDVYATASKIAFISRQMGNGGGIGGVRLAILEMAGFSLGDRIEKQPETKAYTGQIVSFDDIVWKS